MKALCFLLLATLSVARAAPDAPPSAKPSPVTASGDAFVEAERQSHSWLQFPGNVVRSWQLSLRLSTNSYTMGYPISAVVVFKNASTNALSLHVSTPAVPYMFSLTVLDGAGRNIAMNDEARERMEHGHADFAMFRQVAPGGSLAFPVELQHLFFLNRPGDYQIRATARWLPGTAQGNPGSAENTAPTTTGLAPFKLVVSAAPPGAGPPGRPPPPSRP